MQGLYGPFVFPERVLQKIWLRRDFSFESARLCDGRGLRIESPGVWNRLGGPDFKRARLLIEGVKVVGDVEVHLDEASWQAHRHSTDPAYRDVVLHVVLFPTEVTLTVGVADRGIPILVLLPLLNRGLEDYAEEDVVERLASRASSRTVDEFARLPLPQRRAVLAEEAEHRWREKVKFAGQRVERLGWEAACHHTALEILGYRFNRVPMLRLAAAWPLSRWSDGSVEAEVLYRSEAERWSLQGSRPANHPFRRLQLYARWTRSRPDWPEVLRSWTVELPAVQVEESRALRKLGGWAILRQQWAERLTGSGVTGSRWDTLICDGWIPLLESQRTGWGQLWYHWFPGDLPPYLGRALRQMGVISHSQPLCHGLAQGLLGWWIRQERAGGASVD